MSFERVLIETFYLLASTTRLDELESLFRKTTPKQASEQQERSQQILAKIHAVMAALEEHSSWKVIIDKKPGRRGNPLELLYTLVRMKAEI